MEVNWGTTRKASAKKAWHRMLLPRHIRTRRGGLMLGPRHGATTGGPVLVPLASGHSAGHFWFPLFLQGFCTKMCLLCPSYPPCTGRNHSPGDGQAPGPARPCWSCLGWPQVLGPSGRDEQALLPPVPLG